MQYINYWFSADYSRGQLRILKLMRLTGAQFLARRVLIVAFEIQVCIGQWRTSG